MAPCSMSMSSPNMSMRPYIGVESGTQLEPELSRLIGSAILSDDAIAISCGSFLSSFDVGSRLAGLGVGRFLSAFKGTSGIPHFGQSPGASITTSGCIRQVYFCAVDSATAFFDAITANAVIVTRKSFFIVPEKLSDQRPFIGRSGCRRHACQVRAISGNGRSVRQHALLQDRFSETQTVRRPGIEAFDLDRVADGPLENFQPIFARADQLQRDRICREGFCHSGANIFAAGNFLRRFFLRRRGVHRAAAHFRNGFSRSRKRTERAMIRQGEPRCEREKNYQRSSCSLHKGCSPTLLNWQFASLRRSWPPLHAVRTNRTSLVAEHVAANPRAFRAAPAQQLRVSLSRSLLRGGRFCSQFSPGPESEGISGDRRQLQSLWVSPSRARLFLCLRVGRNSLLRSHARRAHSVQRTAHRALCLERV